jgi:hypothetical protein
VRDHSQRPPSCGNPSLLDLAKEAPTVAESRQRRGFSGAGRSKTRVTSATG